MHSRGWEWPNSVSLPLCSSGAFPHPRYSQLSLPLPPPPPPPPKKPHCFSFSSSRSRDTIKYERVGGRRREGCNAPSQTQHLQPGVLFIYLFIHWYHEQGEWGEKQRFQQTSGSVEVCGPNESFSAGSVSHTFMQYECKLLNSNYRESKPLSKTYKLLCLEYTLYFAI